LRMVGFDTELVGDDRPDSELLDQSRDEFRILLTRDRGIISQDPRVKILQVQTVKPDEQFREVLEKTGALEAARGGLGFFSLCLDCNSRLLVMPADEAASRVPAGILEDHDRFWLCPRCERVYWEGSHTRRMREWLDRVLA
jgi:uncharacterized protein with PIN domain